MSPRNAVPLRRRRQGEIARQKNHQASVNKESKEPRKNQCRKIASILVCSLWVVAQPLLWQYKKHVSPLSMDLPSSSNPIGMKRPVIPWRPLPTLDWNRDYGGLEITRHASSSLTVEDVDRKYNHARRAFLYKIDEHVDEEWMPDEDLAPNYQLQKCRRNNWETRIYSTCNLFHELPLSRLAEKDTELQVRYLAHGSYRDTWLLADKTSARDVGFIWKSMIMKKKKLGFDQKRFREIQRDAIVMERLTSSPRIPNIYGLCGTSLIQERLVDQVQSDLLGGGPGYLAETDPIRERHAEFLPPRNNLTLTNKLDMAIGFAESLAELHGFVGGAIMHGDFHSPQWLYGFDGIMKLNDYNKAFIFRYSEQEQKYCPVCVCQNGSYRSPEEQRCDTNATEASDVFTLGNDFYMILTGFWPHYEYRGHRKDLYDQIEAGTRLPYIHENFRNRSLVESALVRLMEECWAHNPDQRPTAFDVLQQLNSLKDEHDIAESKQVKGRQF